MRCWLIKTGLLHLAPLFLLFVLQPRNTLAQSNSIIKGVVQNNNNSEPIPGVSVVIRNTRTNFTAGTSTDSSGVFSFSRITSGGPYSFTFSNVGYEPQT